MWPWSRRKETKGQNDAGSIPQCVRDCKRYGVCHPMQEKVIDSAKKSFRESLKTVRADIQSLSSKIKHIEESILTSKSDDSNYTLARTGQIGLLTLDEVFRIQQIMGESKDRKTGAVDFDLYAIDKYFGYDYHSCIDVAQEMRRLCRDYDRAIEEKNEKDREEAKRNFTELITPFVAQICTTLVKGGILPQEKLEDVTRSRDRVALRELMEGFRKTIHEVVAGKTKAVSSSEG